MDEKQEVRVLTSNPDQRGSGMNEMTAVDAHLTFSGFACSEAHGNLINILGYPWKLKRLFHISLNKPSDS